ncbi:MAG: hypothetical protein AAFU85_19295 [Planctomycetota bacterium]
MKRITSLDELTHCELSRIRATLVARFKVSSRSNIRDVTFGVAEKDGELDESRPNSILFFVKNKRGVTDGRLPRSVRVRVRRGRQFVSVELDSDVVELGGRAKLTGKRIYFRGRSRNGGTAGCVVVWKRVGTHRFKWGVLTVSHIMPNDQDVPEQGTSVLLTGPLARQRGRLVALSTGTGLDAALVQVSRAQLVQTGVISQSQSTRGLKIRDRDQLAIDRGAKGFTRPIKGALPITVQAFTSEFSMLEEEIGVLTDVVQVSSARGAFVKGTSGSLWSIKRQVACLQFGQIGNSSRGLGQPIAEIVEWAASTVGSHGRIPRSEVDFRVVAAI